MTTVADSREEAPRRCSLPSRSGATTEQVWALDWPLLAVASRRTSESCRFGTYQARVASLRYPFPFNKQALSAVKLALELGAMPDQPCHRRRRAHQTCVVAIFRHPSALSWSRNH